MFLTLEGVMQVIRLHNRAYHVDEYCEVRFVMARELAVHVHTWSRWSPANYLRVMNALANAPDASFLHIQCVRATEAEPVEIWRELVWARKTALDRREHVALANHDE